MQQKEDRIKLWGMMGVMEQGINKLLACIDDEFLLYKIQKIDVQQAMYILQYSFLLF